MRGLGIFKGGIRGVQNQITRFPQPIFAWNITPNQNSVDSRHIQSETIIYINFLLIFISKILGLMTEVGCPSKYDCVK